MQLDKGFIQTPHEEINDSVHSQNWLYDDIYQDQARSSCWLKIRFLALTNSPHHLMKLSLGQSKQLSFIL
uniref:Uncharacterized protein n=1 Tax=Arundo donax TaxID=35708 RepID=A0A0A9CSC9_ARUDO